VKNTNGCLCSNVTPDEGHGERTKHVELSSLNKSQDTVASRWIYLYVLKYDARKHEPKIKIKKLNVLALYVCEFWSFRCGVAEVFVILL
jgi:hypothetical protein